MKLTSVLALAIVGFVSASPLPAEESAVLEARQSALTCGSTSYSTLAVQQSYGEGADHTEQQTTVTSSGGTKYPHVFNNYENLSFPSCSGQTLYEFPLKPENQVFTGGKPGADRVVYSQQGQNQFTYCGSMTHTGAAKGKFVRCSG